MINDGKGLEGRILWAAQTYLFRGQLTLDKVDAPTKVVGKRGALRVIMLESQWVDFAGAWTERGGRMVIIEAKSTASDSVACGKDGGITKRQWEALQYWHAAGAAVGVIIETPGPLYWWWTVPMITESQKQKRMIKAAEGQPVISADGVLVDFRRNLWRSFPKI